MTVLMSYIYFCTAIPQATVGFVILLFVINRFLDPEKIWIEIAIVHALLIVLFCTEIIVRGLDTVLADTYYLVVSKKDCLIEIFLSCMTGCMTRGVGMKIYRGLYGGGKKIY